MATSVWQTFLVLAAIYFVFMLSGALGYRVPPEGWAPTGWTAPTETRAAISRFHVHLKDAHKTPQFWLIWLVLLNVSASIGIIGVASPMMQEIFGGRLIVRPVGCSLRSATLTRRRRRRSGGLRRRDQPVPRKGVQQR